MMLLSSSTFIDPVFVFYPHSECTHLLLAHGAPVKVKNLEGWSPLAEAISYGDRQTSMLSNLYPFYYSQKAHYSYLFMIFLYFTSRSLLVVAKTEAASKGTNGTAPSESSEGSQANG